MEFLSAHNFRLSYRRGRDNPNTDFLSQLPLPTTEEDISSSSAISDPDDLAVYPIVCGYITPSCSIPGVDLGGLVLLSYPTPGAGLGGLAPLPVNPVLARLPLTNDDFRTHRAPMPTLYMISLTTRPYAAHAKESRSSYVSARTDTPWPPCARRTQSQATILIGNVLSHPAIARVPTVGLPRQLLHASSEGPASLVTASTLGPSRLHDSTGSCCLSSPDAGSVQPPVGPLASCDALYPACPNNGL